MNRTLFDRVIEIEGTRIGEGCPVFIIAEIGINHGGKIRLARGMIDAAADCGVDCVKFQTFRAEEFMSDRSLEYEYVSRGKRVRETMFAMFKRTELSASGYAELFGYARKKGLVPLSSVADALSADMIGRLGAGAFKLSSEDLINLPLIEHVAAKKKPLILSTGMADSDEIARALGVLRRCGCHSALFMHCVSVYPVPDCGVNLLRMQGLKKAVRAPVGYSDHSKGIEAVGAAVALGACAVEKHFTTDRSLAGPDQSLSADTAEMARLVKLVRKTEKMLGSPALEPGEQERELRGLFRRSIVAARNLAAGTKIGKRDIALKRPGTGLHPSRVDSLIGKILTRPLFKDEQLTNGHFMRRA